MKLPPGATGFGLPDGLAGPDDVRTFMTACHDAARRTGGSVARAQESGATPSFHAASIVYGDEKITILRHIRLPLIAFARESGPQAMTADPFIDRPALADILAQDTHCQVLSAPDLNSPLTEADMTDLTVAEHHQISYWKPATLGALLFNYWD
jgi:hypothetical protein